MLGDVQAAQNAIKETNYVYNPGTRVPVSAGGPATRVRVRVYPSSAGSGTWVQILRPGCNSRKKSPLEFFSFFQQKTQIMI